MATFGAASKTECTNDVVGHARSATRAVGDEVHVIGAGHARPGGAFAARRRSRSIAVSMSASVGRRSLDQAVGRRRQRDLVAARRRRERARLTHRRCQRVPPLDVRAASTRTNRARSASGRCEAAATPGSGPRHGQREREREQHGRRQRHGAADALPPRQLARLIEAHAATAAATAPDARRPDFSRNSHTAAAPAAASSSDACHAAIAPKLMRGTVPCGRS